MGSFFIQSKKKTHVKRNMPASEFTPFDPAELTRVLDEYKQSSLSEPYPFSAFKTLRPFYLLHILKRNKSDCFLPTTNKKLMFLRATGKRLSEKYKDEISELIKKAYPKCKRSKKVIIVPLMIKPTDDNSKNEAHENMLIFNTIRSEVERFEPHGNRTEMNNVYSDRLDRSIQKFVKELDLGLTYIPSPEVFESEDGLQAIEGTCKMETKILPNGKIIEDPGGFCAPWSYFYADMRLKFPQIEAKQLTKQIEKNLGKNPKKLREFIRGQAKFMAQEVTGLEKYIRFQEIADLGRNSRKYIKKKDEYDKFLVEKMEFYTKSLKRKKTENEKQNAKQNVKREIQITTVLNKIKSELSDDETEKYLMSRKFKVNAVDKVGHSPFTMAAYHQKLKTLKYLKSIGANINHIQKNTKDNALSSAIYAAVNCGYPFTVAEYLLSIGVSLTKARKERPVEVGLYDTWKSKKMKKK